MENSTQLDHWATWNEVCEALAFSPLEATEFARAGGFRNGVSAEFREGVGPLAEELAWLVLAGEAMGSNSN